MKLKDFFQMGIWKKWDKSQWTILILTGVLLMVIAIPTGDKQKEGKDPEPLPQAAEEEVGAEDYAQGLEQKLEAVLSRIDGAGRVEVMITLEDAGESVVEKDTVGEVSDRQESDSAGASRTERDTKTTRETVYAEGDSKKTPFVGKEKTPKIAGVLVVAQGGENTMVKQNISEAVMALFQIEVNRIKVVKMNIQEEGY